MHAAHHRVKVRVFDHARGPQTLTELLARPDVVEQCELRGTFGLMAIHGGGLEAMTDVIASRAAELAGASYYGVIHPDDVDHHLPSSRYRPEESPRLNAFVEHVDAVVSLHGYGREGSWTSMLVGGRNRELAEEVADALREHVDGYDAVTELDSIPPELRGLGATNPVNLPRGGGAQLELPPRVRGLSPLPGAPRPRGCAPRTTGGAPVSERHRNTGARFARTGPPPGDDGLSPPTRAVIDALAAVARRWPAP